MAEGEVLVKHFKNPTVEDISGALAAMLVTAGGSIDYDAIIPDGLSGFFLATVEGA